MRIAKTPEDLPTRDEMLSLSGLEFMEHVRDGVFPRPPISGVLNYAVHSVDPRRVVFRGTPDFSHTNPMGGVHGGWYGTLLDSCMGCAVMTVVPRGQIYTTLEYKINIVRALRLGTQIDATGVIDHAGRSTATAKGEIRGVDDGKLYATGSTTCLIMTP